jgi:hypothetical protein
MKPLGLGLLLLCLSCLPGCAHKVAVATLEATIQQAALATQKAAGNAVEKMTLEVTVANGYKGSATLPTPVVPLGLETSLTQTTKLTIEINLKNYATPYDFLPKGTTAPNTYLLDTKTGLLEAVVDTRPAL